MSDCKRQRRTKHVRTIQNNAYSIYCSRHTSHASLYAPSYYDPTENAIRIIPTDEPSKNASNTEDKQTSKDIPNNTSDNKTQSEGVSGIRVVEAIATAAGVAAAAGGISYATSKKRSKNKDDHDDKQHRQEMLDVLQKDANIKDPAHLVCLAQDI